MDRELIDRIRWSAHVPANDPDMDMLARRVRRRRQRRLAGRGVVIAVLLTVVSLGVVQVRGGADHEAVVVEQPPDPDSADVSNVVTPSTYTDGDSVVMPITIPDGTTAELVYPKALDLAKLGVRPNASATLPGCCWGGIWLPEGGESFFAEQGRRINQFKAPDGTPVHQWTMPDVGEGKSAISSYLVFIYDRRHVAVSIHGNVRKGQLAAWVRNFHAQVKEDGFVVLSPGAPLRLARQDNPGPAWLEFGSPDLPHLILNPVRACASHRPLYEQGDQMSSVEVCRASIQIHAYGDEKFVTAVGRHLRVRNVTLANN